MGKMKEAFVNFMNGQAADMSDAEYQDWLRNEAPFVSQEEKQSQHDAWWNSLTEEQKQQLYIDQEEAFKQDKS